MVIAAALALWLLADVVGEGGEPASARLVPRLIDEPPARIEIERPGARTIALERAEGGWQLRAPIEGPANPDAVRALLGALELLESRRAAERELEHERGRVRLTWPDGGASELIVGGPAAGGALAWVGRAGESAIHAVDAHGAGELLAELEALRGRQPFARLGAVRAIEVELGAGASGRLELAPPRLILAGGAVPADDAAARQLAAAARTLAIARFAAEPAAPGPRARIAVTGSDGAASIEVDGACGGGQLHVESELGAGCVPGAELEALQAIATAPAALLDRQLAPSGALERVELSRGSERLSLELGPEQQDAARRWADELAATLGGEVAPAPGGEPIASARLTGGGETRRLALFRDGERLLLRRGDEPVAFVAGADALELLSPAPDRFRDLTLLRAERTWIRELAWRRDGQLVARWRRGELLEDWRDAAGEPVDAARVERAAAALAPLRAASAGAEPPGERALDLEIELADPLGGEPQRRRFRLAGCAIQPAGDTVWYQLDAQRCRALAP